MDVIGMIRTDVQAWTKAIRRLPDNPIARWMSVIQSRRKLNRRFLTKYGPLIIGALPALAIIGLGIWETSTAGFSPYYEFLNWAVFVFIIVAYIAWAARGLQLSIIDSLAVLSRGRLTGGRYQLDDLASVSDLSDHEIVAGLLRVLLPPLWIRIFVGVLVAWLIVAAGITGFFTCFSDEVAVFLWYSPLTIAGVLVSSILGGTALVLYFLSLGSGAAHIYGSVAGVVVVLTQGAWLYAGVMVVFFATSSFHYGEVYEFQARILSAASALLAPLLFVLLVTLGLSLCSRWPALKPLFAIGTPLLLPGLIFFFAAVSPRFIIFSGGGILTDYFISGLAAHFGNLLPLNLTAIPHLTMLGYSSGRSVLDPGTEIFRYPIMIFTQLGLVWICGYFARIAVAARRSSRA